MLLAGSGKRTLASFTSGRGLTSGRTSNTRFPGRSPVPDGLFKSTNFAGYTTAMNVSQRESLGADGIMANDNRRKLAYGNDSALYCLQGCLTFRNLPRILRRYKSTEPD